MSRVSRPVTTLIAMLLCFMVLNPTTTEAGDPKVPPRPNGTNAAAKQLESMQLASSGITTQSLADCGTAGAGPVSLPSRRFHNHLGEP